jgi:predicted phage baseplate assembly protein
VVVDGKGRATTSPVSYERRLDATTTGATVPALAATQMPLDGEVSSMVAGTRVLVEADIASTATSGGVKRLLERVIAQVDRQSLAWGPLSGASTVLTLDSTLAVTEGSTTYAYADVRGISFHEVVGEPFELHADYASTSAASGHELWFQGSAADAAALARRRLLFAGADGALVEVNALAADSTGIDADQPGLHRVQVDREVDYAQFAYAAPQVTVYGNLADATQGKTEAQVTLGDGDGRAVFQTFAIPKTPLTWLLDTSLSPPQQPQLQLWVDGVEWRHVDSLFNAGPKDHVYVVRDDDAGQSWVQFGDGKTGARLRSGRGNVVALYRTGDGANGPLKADTKPQVARKVVGLDKAFLLQPVIGGSAPESADGARSAAPGTMQSLGRIVSLADHEAEALAIPGVIKARAAWVAVDGQPLVRVSLLTASAAPADAAAAADALRVAVRARGAGRCPLLVVQGARSDVALRMTVGIDPTLRADDLRMAVLEALGATGAEVDGVDSSRGLFSWQLRQFGESVHGSQVVGAAQNVPGVSWVRLDALRPASATSMSLSLASALTFAVPATQRALACAGDRLLALAATDLQLQFVADKEAPLS